MCGHARSTPLGQPRRCAWRRRKLRQPPFTPNQQGRLPSSVGEAESCGCVSVHCCAEGEYDERAWGGGVRHGHEREGGRGHQKAQGVCALLIRFRAPFSTLLLRCFDWVFGRLWSHPPSLQAAALSKEQVLMKHSGGRSVSKWVPLRADGGRTGEGR